MSIAMLTGNPVSICSSPIHFHPGDPVPFCNSKTQAGTESWWRARSLATVCVMGRGLTGLPLGTGEYRGVFLSG